MIPTFHPGDVLVVEPKDGDDPEANNRQGQRCIFLRYSVISKYAVVEFEAQNKKMYFRREDLRKAEKVRER